MTITPYVDPKGQPGVSIELNGQTTTLNGSSVHQLTTDLKDAYADAIRSTQLRHSTSTVRSEP